MKIQVCGFDPSMSNWGIAVAQLDLETGYLDTPTLSVSSPEDLKGKQVRVNSKDLHKCSQLAEAALKAARGSAIIFVEIPVGSQTARAMTSYGICLGILGSIKAENIPLIEVTASEVKIALTGNKTASKTDMIKAAYALYPEANWPKQSKSGTLTKKDPQDPSKKLITAQWNKGDLQSVSEHMADAIGAIHAGCATDSFKTLLRVMRPNS